MWCLNAQIASSPLNLQPPASCSALTTSSHTYSTQLHTRTHNTTMAASWPEWMTDSFLHANREFQISNNASAYYGAHTRLSYHLFGGVEGPFEIHPQVYIPETPSDAIDVAATFTVEINSHPVLFIQVKPPSSFRFDSKCRQADEQIRDRFRDPSLRPASARSGLA